MLLVAEEPPDLVILNWMMPPIRGIEVCHQIKTRNDTRYIPIIMLSARSEDVDALRGLETGADDYMTINPYSARANGTGPHATVPHPPGRRRRCIDVRRHQRLVPQLGND